MYLVLYAMLLVAYVTTIYRLAARGRMAEATPGSIMPVPKGSAA